MEYQKVLKKQISAVLDDLNSKQFETVSDYLVNCYETGYIGTMYDIQNQGIPIIQPIQQDQVVQAVTHDTKLSKSLYQSLDYNVSELKKQIASELSRGISSAMSYLEIARNIQKNANTTLSKSMTIARTEGHRITQTATYNAQRVAKDTGADIVKQWDSTLDRRTRKSHQRVDGEIRELDETFSNGLLYPGDPNGKAAEVINCRCVALQRAKWALDEDELEALKERASYYGLDKTKNFEEYKKKYLKAVEDSENGSIISLLDIHIGKSVGAKASNYDIEPPNKEIVHLTEGTKVSNIETIAGKDRKRKIDEIDFLLDKWGGKEEEWQKKKGFGYVDYEGESYKAELHWYEEPTAGKHKWKVKPDVDGNWFIDED